MNGKISNCSKAIRGILKHDTPEQGPPSLQNDTGHPNEFRNHHKQAILLWCGGSQLRLLYEMERYYLLPDLPALVGNKRV